MSRTNLSKFAHVLTVGNIKVYFHWSVFVVAGLIIIGSIRNIGITLAAGFAYLAMLVIHEYGHAAVARSKGCYVECIDVYPIIAVVHYTKPWNRLDDCLIAWAGVTAQAAIAIPILIVIKTIGYTPWEPLNAALTVLSAFSLLVAAFNLIPQYPLDGGIAWKIIPEAFVRLRKQRKAARVERWR